MEGTATEAEEDRDFYRWYGPWAPYRPDQVAELLAGLAAPWWIVGGWAIETFTGVSREHEDIDVGFLRADLPVILQRLSPGLCAWSNLSGTLRPLRKPEDLQAGARQLWVRRDGSSPWVMDLAMTPHDGETWISPRDELVRRPLGDATFTGPDGIRYLRPELVLSLKANWSRAKEQRDFDVTLPLLSAEARAWLRDTIARVHPEHRWLSALEATAELEPG